MSNGLFSKATRGLRQSDVIKNQHFKLVFVYPMLVDQTLSKHSDLFRNFLTTSMLKELFVSNALNLVNIASQIHPLTDEKGSANDIQSTMRSASDIALSKLSAQANSQHPLESSKQEYQNKILEKTAIIRKLLATDPKLKALNPFVEMITMDNLVDVPVIVGTKKFDVDSAVTQFIFLVSIADKLPLDNPNNIVKIFKRIDETNPEQAWELLNNLVPKQPKLKERVIQWFNKLPGSTSIKRHYQRTASKVRSSFGSNRRSLPTGRSVGQFAKLLSSKPKEFDETESLAIIQAAQTNLAQTKLFFKFCYDINLLKSQFGADISQGQIKLSTTESRVSGTIQNAFSVMYRDFTTSLSRIGGPAITSMINVLYPAESGVDELEIINKFVFTRMLEKIRSFIFDDLMISVNAAIESGGLEESDAKIKELKSLCVGEFRDSDNILKKNHELTVTNEVRSPMAKYDDIGNFFQALLKVSSSSSGQSRTVEQALGTILGGETTVIIDRIYSVVESELSSALDSLARYYYPNFANVAFFRAASAAGEGDKFPATQDSITKIRTQLLDAVVPYIYFLFMYHLQIALCNYISIVDIEIETAKNDVLDHPNYTLVVPVQTIEAVANALVAKNWKQLLQSETSGRPFVGAVGDNYVKGIVKYMKQRLGVPNLIVVDEAKGDVFYQLMYHSAPQKTKLKTLETFIKLTTKEELQGQLPGTAFPSGYY